VSDRAAGGLSWRTGWTGARSLAELVRSPSGLGEYQVDFRFPLLDLSQLSDDEIAGEPILRSTLRLLKYSRSDHLARKLGEILQLIAQSLPEGRLPQWIQAIGVYIMSVNKDMDSPQYKQTLKSVFPTQFEPGSLADRLLIQGREEGRRRSRRRQAGGKRSRCCKNYLENRCPRTTSCCRAIGNR
jgi:hypothetical protein